MLTKDKNLPMETLISIIIPSYNQGKYIENTILSVINQSHSNWELIIQDGNSQDNTKDICCKYMDKDSRIKFYSEPDNGYADAVNKALDKCEGDIVSIQSSDDFYANEFVFREVNKIYQSYPDLAIISGQFIMVDENLEQVSIAQNKQDTGFIMAETVFTMNNHFAQSATFFSRERAKLVGKLDQEVDIVADTDFWIKLATYKPICINKIYRSTQIWGCVLIQPSQRSNNLIQFSLGRAKMSMKHFNNPNIDLDIEFKRKCAENNILSSIESYVACNTDPSEPIALYKKFTGKRIKIKKMLKYFLAQIGFLRKHFYKDTYSNSISDLVQDDSPKYNMKWF